MRDLLLLLALAMLAGGAARPRRDPATTTRIEPTPVRGQYVAPTGPAPAGSQVIVPPAGSQVIVPAPTPAGLPLGLGPITTPDVVAVVTSTALAITSLIVALPRLASDELPVLRSGIAWCIASAFADGVAAGCLLRRFIGLAPQPETSLILIAPVQRAFRALRSRLSPRCHTCGLPRGRCGHA
jgi:hypothetical protein